MKKTIWSSNGDLDKLYNMSDDEKRDYIDELVGDQEMVASLTDDEFDKFISSNMDIYNNAAEDFENNIAPIIASQVKDGLILDENFNLIDPSVLLNYNGYSATLDEDDNGELWFDVEGRKPFPILGFSPDQDEFVWQLNRLGILDTLHNLYPDWEDEDINISDVDGSLPFNWALLEEVLTRPAFLEDFREDKDMNEAVSTKNVKGLKKELEEIKELADEYGRSYFTEDMPFSNFDNDPTSIEYQYPEFYNVAYNFFKEMDFNKDKDSDDPMKNDEFKYLQQNDPAKLDDMMDELWYALDQSGWDTIIDMCDILIRKNGVTTQAKDVYKKHYKSVLDDDQILADRKAKEAELEESLNEGLSDDNSRYFLEYIEPIAEESDLRVSKDSIDGGVEISVTSYDGMWAEYDFLDSGKVIVRGEAIDDPSGELEFNSYEEFAKWQDSIGAWDEDGEGTVLKSYKQSLNEAFGVFADISGLGEWDDYYEGNIFGVTKENFEKVKDILDSKGIEYDILDPNDDPEKAGLIELDNLYKMFHFDQQNMDKLNEPDRLLPDDDDSTLGLDGKVYIDDKEIILSDDASTVGEILDDSTIELLKPELFSDEDLRKMSKWSKNQFGSGVVKDKQGNVLYESLTEETGVTKVGDEDNADRWFNSTTYIGGKNNFEVSTDCYDSKGQSKSYTASRWSHNYKNVQEVEDDIVNLQALKDRMLELEDKGFKNSELRESLSEGAAEEMAMHDLKEEVANYIYEFYLADVDDNIAHAVHAAIPQYDIDWCPEEPTFNSDVVETKKKALARAIADVLFENAPRELGESIKEECEVNEEIWHNRGAGDCKIIERSASGRNALIKRLADGALQPYVIALGMGKDSWGQGKYYTELEDARRDWKRYKYD